MHVCFHFCVSTIPALFNFGLNLSITFFFLYLK